MDFERCGNEHQNRLDENASRSNTDDIVNGYDCKKS